MKIYKWIEQVKPRYAEYSIKENGIQLCFLNDGSIHEYGDDFKFKPHAWDQIL